MKEITQHQINRYKNKLELVCKKLKDAGIHHETIFRKNKVEVRFFTYREKSCIHNDEGHVVSLHIAPSFDLNDAVFLAGQDIRFEGSLRYRVRPTKCKVNTYFGSYGPKDDRCVTLKTSFTFDMIYVDKGIKVESI